VRYMLRTKMLHPDRFDQTSQRAEWNLANEMLKELNHAYGLLGDAASRAEYDRSVRPRESVHVPRREAQPPVSSRPEPEATHSWLAAWIDVAGLNLAQAWDRALDRALNRCQNCKGWWSARHELNRAEMRREPAWSTVTRSQTTYRQDRDPAHSYITEWQETVPVTRIVFRVTYQCPKCSFSTCSYVHQDWSLG
jgi:curved DNA-binding protein CbpA